MGIAENKKVIRDYFDTLGKGDFPTALGYFAEDITWWVLPSSPLAGTYVGKNAVLDLFGKGTGLYDASVPLQPEVVGLVAEGDKVACELIISGRTAKGQDYKNHYHFLFEVKGGKITGAKEYVDTLYAQRTLFA
jgi:ketosteroid isomerase-like protein